MRTAAQTLDAMYLEMRARVLSLAADFDRVLDGPAAVAPGDPRIVALRDCLAEVSADRAGRAARVQLRLSDPIA